MPLQHQVSILYCVINGYLDNIEINKIDEFEKGFLEYLDVSYSALMNNIARNKDISRDSEKELKEAIKTYKQTVSPKQ
jgi:F-type H+/Na+-transporting ATPase subunit alpha